LFDAQSYFENALRALASCESYAEIVSSGVQVQEKWHSWELILWRVTITFASGEVFEIFESHEKRMKIGHYRKVKYHFMNAGHECIFRVDTHSGAIPFDDPCHLHVGADETVIEEGDPRLHGQSLVGVNFLTILSWVNQHMDGRPFIWEQP